MLAKLETVVVQGNGPDRINKKDNRLERKMLTRTRRITRPKWVVGLGLATSYIGYRAIQIECRYQRDIIDDEIWQLRMEESVTNDQAETARLTQKRCALQAKLEQPCLSTLLSFLFFLFFHSSQTLLLVHLNPNADGFGEQFRLK